MFKILFISLFLILCSTLSLFANTEVKGNVSDLVPIYVTCSSDQVNNHTYTFGTMENEYSCRVQLSIIKKDHTDAMEFLNYHQNLKSFVKMETGAPKNVIEDLITWYQFQKSTTNPQMFQPLDLIESQNTIKDTCELLFDSEFIDHNKIKSFTDYLNKNIICINDPSNYPAGNLEITIHDPAQPRLKDTRGRTNRWK